MESSQSDAMGACGGKGSWSGGNGVPHDRRPLGLVPFPFSSRGVSPRCFLLVHPFACQVQAM